MKVDQIINDLLSHDISKGEAIHRLKGVVDGFRNNKAIEFHVESVSFSVESNHGFLKIKVPYGYSKIKEVNKGDRVDVTLIP